MFLTTIYLLRWYSTDPSSAKGNENFTLHQNTSQWIIHLFKYFSIVWNILLSLFEFVSIAHLRETIVSPSFDWVLGDNKRVFWDPITSGHWSRLSQLTAKTINQWDSEADTDFSLGRILLLWDPIDWLRPAQFLGHKSLAFWPTDQQFLESGSVSKMIGYKSEISTSFSTGKYFPKLPCTCTDQLNKLLDNYPSLKFQVPIQKVS